MWARVCAVLWSTRLSDAVVPAQMKGDRGDGKVNRRVVLALASLPLLGVHKAEAMSEAEEIAKLQLEASRIQEIFDVQKAANSNLPSLKDSLKAAKAAKPAPPSEQVAERPPKSEDPAGIFMLWLLRLRLRRRGTGHRVGRTSAARVTAKALPVWCALLLLLTL